MFSNSFLPSIDQTKKIESFDDFDRFNFAYKMSPLHRILIASRDKAKPGMFYRTISDYKSGFTDGNMNFWIKKLHSHSL